jgi:catechol 2,3-dioxygenase-like lactoylglutathione lyase family enzyme
MAIVGIESIIYGVDDVATSTQFFVDFGLKLVDTTRDSSRFLLEEGSSVIIRHTDDPALPASSVVGCGVKEVVWGVDGPTQLEALSARLSEDRAVRRDPDGSVHFVTDFGCAMGLRLFSRKAVLTAPDPVNSVGRVSRLNQHRKWRLRAYPKVVSHVVFAVPNYLQAAAFMRDRLDFRLSDSQRGFGEYLRTDGSNNHHSFLLLNAEAHLPGMDGKLRFHHANFGVEDIDEIMVGANYMTRRGWAPSSLGLGRHRIDSALFYYLPCPAGGEAEYGADSDYVDESWVPRDFVEPLFAYSHFVHNLPPFLMEEPAWSFKYLTNIQTRSDTPAE